MSFCDWWRVEFVAQKRRKIIVKTEHDTIGYHLTDTFLQRYERLKVFTNFLKIKKLKFPLRIRFFFRFFFFKIFFTTKFQSKRLLSDSSRSKRAYNVTAQRIVAQHGVMCGVRNTRVGAVHIFKAWYYYSRRPHRRRFCIFHERKMLLVRKHHFSRRTVYKPVETIVS